MTRKTILIALTVLALAAGLVLSGCGEKKAIKIPVVSPYTGQLASFGEGVKNGALLKGEEINAAGGINGRKVEIVLEDDLCEAKEAANIATKLANDPEVSILVGHLCSSATMAGIPIYTEKTLPFISPASTNNEIGKLSPYSFRNVYKDDFQGTFLAQYAAKAMGWKRIAIFYENNDYSRGLKDAFMAEAKNQGLEILGEEAYNSDTTDFKAQLTKFKAAKPEAILIPGYAPQAKLIMTQAAQLGLKPAYFGADGLDDAILLNTPEAEGLLITTPFLPDRVGPEGKAFVEAYKAKYGVDPNYFAANTYDAVGMAAEAVQAVGQDREKIREHLAGIDSPEKAYKGVAGATFFDGNGDCSKPAFVKTIKGGKWVSAEKQLAE